MDDADRQRVQQFLKTWKGSQGNERANYQGFFLDLCDALGVDRPPPKGNIPGDPYAFDKDIRVIHKDGFSTNYADFYKEGHFLIEAKQGGSASNKGTAKRGTKTYDTAMERAFYQALSYAPFLPGKPPFVMTCDIGSHFELWISFSGNYGGYGARETIPLDRLLDEKVFDRFVQIFADPQSLNPEKYRAKVTREVADTLAKLAKWLEAEGKPPQETANFLMRCIFTMFAEDVDLLRGEVFTQALKNRWMANPALFKPEIETLWQTMNTGGNFGFERILRFNGSFFAHAIAFDLPKAQLEILFEAAEKDWAEVEPAIFGTLLERALDKQERSRLGAHYTPRSYVERLVRPVVLEPLREEWLLVESEVDRLLTLKEGQESPTKAQRQKAVAEIEAFLAHLRSTRILDPACGSGNFLYVTLDLLKTLEREVETRLLDVVGIREIDLLETFDPRLASHKQVNPAQFLGIEINPRAAAIAELVIWIGYLQWHFKRYGTTPPPEPILQDFHNIEHRDAVLAYDGKQPDIDPKTGTVRTRWGGRTMQHSVTGEAVPDPSDQVTIYRYINPRPAEWQEADYIVSNPPFIGNARMRDRLGDGYTETLRHVYKDVPETVDYVMYWWHKAAERVQSNQVAQFGFITTNSIHQARQRTVIDFHQNQKNPIRLIFAIADHPWVNEGAAVRIAMTIGQASSSNIVQMAQLGTVVREIEAATPEDSAEQVQVKFANASRISSDLKADIDLTKSHALRANSQLSSRGMMLFGSGFIVEQKDFNKIEQEVLFKYLNGRDLLQQSRNVKVIDLYCGSGSFLTEVQKQYPNAYQWVLERVKPERDANRDKGLRENWWIFGRPRTEIRPALEGIKRYIATVETAKHRVFVFLDSDVVPDNMLIAIALENAYFLGILSSKAHVAWALAAGGRLGVGNDPRYNKTRCFDPFPFPVPTPEQEQKIRELGERLDAHRKRVQSQHPDVTITGMYNLLEKLRRGEAFTDADRTYNDKALVSTLKQIHDELDVAVLAAYGWQDLTANGTIKDGIDEIILERLVALNADRAAEERNGLVRWLRPDYQAPNEVQTQQVLTGVEEAEATVIAPVEQKPFPKAPKDQLATIRDLLRTSGGEWTIDQIAAQFKGGGRYKGAIGENLERLEWFGVLLCRPDGQTKRWQFAELQQSA